LRAEISVRRRNWSGIRVSPRTAALGFGETIDFDAVSYVAPNAQFSWSIEEGELGGHITADGVYTAPNLAGRYHVVATRLDDPTRTTRATVTVVAPAAAEPPPPIVAPADPVHPDPAAPPSSTPPPSAAPAPACVYRYSEWSACQADGTQRRTVASALPAGCAGTPVVSQACTSVGSGPQFFVAPNGSDSNPGTATAPWRTIQNAMNKATPGSTVNIRAGTYTEQLSVNVSGSPGNYITFQAAGFGGAPNCGGAVQGKGGPACAGDAVIVDLAPLSPNRNGTPFLLVNGKSYVRIQGLTFRNYQTIGSGRGVDIIGASHHVEVLHNRFLNNKSIGPYGYYEVLMHFYVRAPATNVVVRGNEFGDIVGAYSEAFTVLSTNNVTVENNWFHRIDQIALDIGPGGGAGVVVRGNLIEDSGYLYGGGAIYLTGSSGVLVESNTVRNCTNANAWAIETVPEPGYAAQTGNVIRNNVIHGNSNGIMIGSWSAYSTSSTAVTNTLVANNTIYDNGVGIATNWGSGIVWKNNAVAGNRVGVTFASGHNGSGHRFEYNLVHGNNYNQWGSASHSADIVAAPQFANPAAGDFRLAPGSPARNGGDPSAGDFGAADIAGAARVQGGRIDVGAHEAG
jgi:hypothetical protein